MPFDVVPDRRVFPGRTPSRRPLARTNHHAGLSAEQAVARHYCAAGAILRDIRWRGRCGEIDLILAEGETIVFVEVKKSKTHAAAAERLTAHQIGRLMRSAEDYLATCPKGTLTEARFDVALVDASGTIEILPNVSVMG